MDFQSLDKKVESNMDLIVDMFDGSLNFDDKIDSDKNEQYYIGKAENIIKQLDKTNYYVLTYAIGSSNNRMGLSLVARMVVFIIVRGNRNRVKGFCRKKTSGINGRTGQIRKRPER